MAACLVFGAIVIGCSQEELKQEELSPISAETLTKELDNIVRDSPIPGFGIALVQNERIVYKNGFGFQDVESQIPYTVDTQQPIASISKTFIGASIAQALSLNLFTLDTPINDILPQPITNPHYPSVDITVRHLVNHSSSIMDEEEAYYSTYYVSGETDANIDLASPTGQLYLDFELKITDNPRTLAQLVNAYFQPSGELYNTSNFAKTKPGDRVEYSNLASSLAAYVVEVASGMPYEEFLQTYVLYPLNMYATGFDGREVAQSQHARLYIDDIPMFQYRFESFPDGGLRSTTGDLSLYLLDMMKGQSGSSNVQFESTVYKALFTKDGDYSLFWSATDKGSFQHSGGDPGISTLIGFGPNLGGGLVFIMNLDEETKDNEDFLMDLWEQKLAPLVKAFLLTDH